MKSNNQMRCAEQQWCAAIAPSRSVMELGAEGWKGAVPHPAPQSSWTWCLPYSTGQIFENSHPVSRENQRHGGCWGDFSLSYLLHLSQKLRIHCSVCQSLCPAGTGSQRWVCSGLPRCQTTPCCYWYHQTCRFKEKIWVCKHLTYTRSLSPCPW